MSDSIQGGLPEGSRSGLGTRCNHSNQDHAALFSEAFRSRIG
jgi:hypothetical protein